MERVLNALVSVKPDYDAQNERAYRQYVEGEFALTYRKTENLIIPYGYYLGFNGVTGKEVVLGLNGSDQFTISIDGATAFALASDSSVSSVSAEVIAARQGEANLSTKVTLVNNAAVSAGSVAATAQSEVTAARQGEPSLTAKVTQLSAATATVDGKLSASYALTVDVNGRIASMKLLSNGTTSSVKFLATTFSIYDGTSDVATFEVSGGNVYVAGSKVRTESMVANAITTASDFEDDSSVTVGSSFTQVSEVTISTVDASTRVFVSFSNYIDSSTDGSLMDARIKRNGTVIWGPKAIAGDPPGFSYTFDTEGLIEYTPAFSGMVSAFDTDVPGVAGSYTYALELRVAGSVSSPWDVTYRRLFALAFKR